jgi:hypothetical protein
MRKWRLAATATLASGLLAGGMFAAFNLAAQAAANSCTATEGSTQTTELTCAIASYTITSPESVTLSVTTSPGSILVDLSESMYCVDPADQDTTTETNTPSVTTSSTGTATYSVPMPLDDATSCVVTASSATVDSSNTSPLAVASLELAIDDVAQPVSTATATATASASPTASTSSSAPATVRYNNQVHGFDGTCMDDKGNSSADRAEAIIWSCNNTDQAQGWSYSGDELKIHGMCLNAKGNGKTGSKLILWTCTGSGNEIFAHRSDGEFAEKANGWSVCIDDPGYSTKNGTQLFVYHCNDGANQHFTEP